MIDSMVPLLLIYPRAIIWLITITFWWFFGVNYITQGYYGSPQILPQTKRIWLKAGTLQHGKILCKREGMNWSLAKKYYNQDSNSHLLARELWSSCFAICAISLGISCTLLFRIHIPIWQHGSCIHLAMATKPLPILINSVNKPMHSIWLWSEPV